MIRVCEVTGSQINYHEREQEFQHADTTRCDHKFNPVEVVEASPSSPGGERVTLYRSQEDGSFTFSERGLYDEKVEFVALPASPGGDEERCPTCGETGPDTAERDFDSGQHEAACGDEWHDSRLLPGGDEVEAVAREEDCDNDG